MDFPQDYVRHDLDPEDYYCPTVRNFDHIFCSLINNIIYLFTEVKVLVCTWETTNISFNEPTVNLHNPIVQLIILRLKITNNTRLTFAWKDFGR